LFVLVLSWCCSWQILTAPQSWTSSADEEALTVVFASWLVGCKRTFGDAKQVLLGWYRWFGIGKEISSYRLLLVADPDNTADLEELSRRGRLQSYTTYCWLLGLISLMVIDYGRLIWRSGLWGLHPPQQ
jgi:hypothetical protein